VCHFEYKFARSDAASVLAHPITIALGFTLLTGLSCWLLGYVPLLQFMLIKLGVATALSFSGTTLIVVLMHMLNGMILVGLIGFLGMAITWCCGYDRYYSPYDTCQGCYCPGYFCADVGGCTDCLAVGACEGEAGLFVMGCMLATMLVMALFGLLFMMPKAYAFIYEMVQEAAGATVRMVENVGGSRAGSAQWEHKPTV